jgi:ABC-type nitrate/sulfonate/bicarbonate transport system substrate-binding protein
MQMTRRKICLGIIFAGLLLAPLSYAQPQLKKIRMGISTTSIAFLSIYAAQLKGFYRDEGIDLELILMPATLASSAVLTGDIDYNGAVTGVIGAAVQGRPMKVLIFTADRSLQSIISRKEIKEFKDLKGKKIAGSTPGATATLLARLAARHFGLDPDRDVGILTMGGGDSARLAALETGIADATVLSVPISIVAVEKGYRELFFLGEIARFPQTGFGTSDKKIKENPDEVYRMVRATMRGLLYTWDEQNRDAVLDIIMKRLKIEDRRFANEVFKQRTRGLTKDASVRPEGVQALIDLQRDAAKVTRSVPVAQVIDYSFVEKARKDLGLVR